MLNNEGAYDYKLNGNPKGASPKILQRNGNKMKMKVKKIQDILDGRLKKYQSNTYNELDRFGDLRLYRFYQFVVAYKRALEN